MGGSLRRVFEIATGFNLATIFESSVRGVISLTGELVKLGLETQRQEQAFARMTQSLGVRGDALASEIERMSRGLVDASDVMVGAATALQEGLRPEQLTQLAEVAIEQSKLMGTTVTQAYNQMLEAVIRLEERGLKSAKIFIDTKQVFDDYAKSIGTVAEKLTDAEKRQALMNATLAKGQEQARAMGGATLDASQEVERLGVAIQNVRESIAKNFVDIGAIVARNLIEPVQSAIEAFRDLDRTIVGMVSRALSLLPYGASAIGEGLARARAALDVRDIARSEAGMFAGLGAGPDLGVNRNAAAPTVRPQTEAELKRATAEAEKAAAAVAKFRNELVQLAVTDETARTLMGIRQSVAELSREFPALASQFAAIGEAREKTFLAVREQQEALKAETEALKAVDAGWVAHAEAVLAATEAEQMAEVAIANTARALEEQARAQIDAGWVAHAEAVLAATEADQRAEIAIIDARNAVFDYGKALALADTQAKILGSDFDLMGARVDASRRAWDDAVAAFQKGHITLDQLIASGERFRAALADQSLYRDIEVGFLSITDTFTKMADGLIQGTLDIGDAFANLGRNLLTNFVQLVIHQVFDPLLKEAASFVSGLLGLLTGRGGLVQGAGGAAAVGLVGAVGSLFGGGTNFSTEQVAAIMSGGGAANGGGGSSALGTLGTVGSGLSTLYTLGAWVLNKTGIAQLPSLLDLVAKGATSLASSLGLLAPSLTAAEVSTLGLAASGLGAASETSFALASSATATSTAGAGLVGASGASLTPGLIGGGIVLAVPMLAGFLNELGREEIRWRSIQRQRAQSGFSGQLEARLAAAELGRLPESDLATLHRDIGIMLASAEGQAGATIGRTPDELAGPAFNETATARAFAAQARALGYQPVESIDLGQGAMSTLSQASVDLLQRYITLLDRGVDAWGNAATVAMDFDREALTRELLANPTQIALLLDLPSLQREGEDAGQTMARMVQALDGLDAMMTRLAFDAQALRGALDVPAVLAENLDRVSKAMDAANIALATTQDPEQMLAAATELEALTRQRYALEVEAVQTLVSLLQQQAGALASGFAGLAQAAPVLRELGLEVGGMAEGLGAVVDLLGEVGDTAGQLATLRTQVGTIGGSSPAEILASAQALQRSLSATAAGVNALGDAQQRMAGLVELLGDVTAGYQAATAALSAHYDALREAQTQAFAERSSALREDLDRSIRLVQDYYSAQRGALANLVSSSRQWEASARRLRDQVTALQTSDLSPLNPADQLVIARQQLADSLVRFWSDPAADVADEVSALAGRVLDVGAQVFSRPSPEFAALFSDITGTLGQVASAAAARVTPEQESARLLAEINAREAATLATLGVVADANKAVYDRISGGVTVFDPNAEAWLAGVVAQGQATRGALDTLTTDHAARLDAIAAEQAAATEAARAGFAAVAEQVVGTTAAIYATGSSVERAIWIGDGKLDGIWGALDALWREAQATRSDLVSLTDGATVAQRIDALNAAQAQALEGLRANVRESLEAVVGRRIDALVAQGGQQAVVDALTGVGGVVGAVKEVNASLIYRMERLISTQSRSPAFQEGTWSAPGGTAILHPGEVVVPASMSAAQWVREGGLLTAEPRAQGPPAAGPVTVEQHFHRADPEAVAELAARKVLRYLNAQHGMRL